MPADTASNMATGMPLAKPFFLAALTSSSLEKNSTMLSGLVMSIPASWSSCKILPPYSVARDPAKVPVT